MRDKSRCHWLGAGITLAIAGTVLWFIINGSWTINGVGVLERAGWPWSLFYVWTVAGAALGIAAEVIRYRRERRRAGLLERLAEDLGFKYRPQVAKEDLNAWSPIPVFRKWSAARNHLAGQFADVPVEMLDYTYVERGRENETSYDQTVALLPAANDDMPAFDLTPRTFGIRMLSALGYQGIQFSALTTSPVDAQIVEKFNKNYHLASRGDAESKAPDADIKASQEHDEAVGRWFTLDTLGFFANHAGWHVQSAGGRLALWRPKKLVAPANRSKFLEEALAARDALSKSQGARSRATLAAETPGEPAETEARSVAAALGSIGGFFAGGILGGIAAGWVFFNRDLQHSDSFFLHFLLSAVLFFGGAIGGLFLGLFFGRRALSGLVKWHTARRTASVAKLPGRLQGQPVTSDAVVAQSDRETTITLPATGLVRGCGCFVFVWALLWNLFIVIATPFFLIAAFRGEMKQEGSNEPVHPAIMTLFLTPFWIVGLTAIWFIVYRGRRRGRIVVSPDRLLVEEVSVLGTQRHELRREELTAVRLVEEPENRSCLSIQGFGRVPVEVFRHRAAAELAWIARVVNERLALSRPGTPAEAP
jgi:MFS family permease